MQSPIKRYLKFDGSRGSVIVLGSKRSSSTGCYPGCGSHASPEPHNDRTAFDGSAGSRV